MSCAGSEPVDDLGDTFLRDDAQAEAQREGIKPMLVCARTTASKSARSIAPRDWSSRWCSCSKSPLASFPARASAGRPKQNMKNAEPSDVLVEALDYLDEVAA